MIFIRDHNHDNKFSLARIILWSPNSVFKFLGSYSNCILSHKKKSFFTWRDSWQNDNSVIYAPSFHSKLVWVCCFCVTWKKIFRKILQCLFLHTGDINGSQNCLVTNILQNVYLCFIEERKSYSFRATWGWIHEDIIFDWAILTI